MTKEDILHHFQDINFYYGDCMTYADLSSMLDELIAENKGEWIDKGNGSYVCSNCKTEWTTSQIEKMCFCPTCGADMRGR